MRGMLPSDIGKKYCYFFKLERENLEREREQKSKLGRISNSTKNNYVFDTKYQIWNKISRSNLRFKFDFDWI